MYNAAHLVELMHYAPEYGFTGVGGGPAAGGDSRPVLNASQGVPLHFSLAELKRRRDEYIARLNGIYQKNLEGSNVKLIRGRARFEGPHRVVVEGGPADGGGEATVVEAEHILVATGSRPALPNVPGVEHCIDSDKFFELDTQVSEIMQAIGATQQQSIVYGIALQPARVLVIGGGYIATELAFVFQALGSKTTIAVRATDGPLRGFDPLVRAELKTHMLGAGLEYLDGFHLDSITKCVPSLGFLRMAVS
jgi:glutathione reductase (NADPH)